MHKNKRLSPSGTTGNLQLSIPKTLLSENTAEIDDILVTLNGIEKPFTIPESTEEWILTLKNYEHSKRTIIVYYVTYPLKVKVTDLNNQPLTNTLITLQGPNSFETSKYTDEGGYAVFENFQLETSQ